MAIADSRSPATLDKARLLDLYERMVQIRTFEDTASKKFADGKMAGFVHLYAGEEAVAVGVCAHLTDKDYIANRAGAYEIPGIVVDGLDVFAVYEAAGEAVARARRGEGPTLIEAKTYRYYGHFEGDTILYRTKEELDAYRQRDPIGALRHYILDHAIAGEQELDAINQRVQARLEQAWDRAEAAPWPAPEEALDDVYVSY